MVYSEDFSSSPSYNLVYTPSGDEYLSWDPTKEVYKARVKDGYGVSKFAVSPKFPEVENQSFKIEADINKQYVSFGQAIRLRFFESSIGVHEGRALDIKFTGSQDPWIAISTGGGTKYRTPETSQDVWYSVQIDYDNISGTADIQIKERKSENIFYERRGVPFGPGPFDKVAVGERVINGEGSYSEAYYDNIVIRSGYPVNLKRWWKSEKGINRLCRKLKEQYNAESYAFFKGTQAGRDYVLILLRDGTKTKRDVVFGLDMDVPKYRKVFLFDIGKEKFITNKKLVRELYYSHYLSKQKQEIVNGNSGVQQNLLPLHYSELAAGFNNPAVKLTPLVASMSAGGHGLASFLITKDPSSAVNTLRGQVIEVIAGVAEAEEKKEKMLEHAKDDGRFSDDAISGYRVYQACKRNLEALQLAKKGYSEVIKGPDSIAEKLHSGRTLTKGAFSKLLDILLGQFLPTKGIVETGQYFAYSKEFAEAAQDLMAGHEYEEESGEIKGAEYYRGKLAEHIDQENYETAKNHHLNMAMRTSKALTQLALAYEFQRKALKANEGKIEWEIADYIRDYMDDISVKDKLSTLESRREEMIEWSRRVLFWFLKPIVWGEQASQKLAISGPSQD